uniref:Uncharacterized protein n=1 Tax=Heterorhabditis bacteriophora TaxID=37862 RepID=A0A1I7XGZ3_HETBA
MNNLEDDDDVIGSDSLPPDQPNNVLTHRNASETSIKQSGFILATNKEESEDYAEGTARSAVNSQESNENNYEDSDQLENNTDLVMVGSSSSYVVQYQ